MTLMRFSGFFSSCDITARKSSLSALSASARARCASALSSCACARSLSATRCEASEATSTKPENVSVRSGLSMPLQNTRWPSLCRHQCSLSERPCAAAASISPSSQSSPDASSPSSAIGRPRISSAA